MRDDSPAPTRPAPEFIELRDGGFYRELLEGQVDGARQVRPVVLVAGQDLYHLGVVVVDEAEEPVSINRRCIGVSCGADSSPRN